MKHYRSLCLFRDVRFTWPNDVAWFLTIANDSSCFFATDQNNYCCTDLRWLVLSKGGRIFHRVSWNKLLRLGLRTMWPKLRDEALRISMPLWGHLVRVAQRFCIIFIIPELAFSMWIRIIAAYIWGGSRDRFYVQCEAEGSKLPVVVLHGPRFSTGMTLLHNSNVYRTHNPCYLDVKSFRCLMV